jgi:transaldolase
VTPNPILSSLHEQGQSPWLDNLARPLLHDETIKHLIDQGVRGITSNPTIFQHAIETTDQYDQQYLKLRQDGLSNEDAYGELVKTDVGEALDLFANLHRDSKGLDGFVSLEVSPRLAHDAAATTADALRLIAAIQRPNLMIKVPATDEGLVAIKELISQGHSINVTLIFGLERYEQVIEAYLSGLEAASGDLSKVQSVASFFISRVDTAIDPRLEAIGTPEAKALFGRAAVAQAILAYQVFEQKFSGSRWQALVARGAQLQRPLWASTSVKNPAYPSLMYVTKLVAAHTVDTIPGSTLKELQAATSLEASQINETGYKTAAETVAKLTAVGINLAQVNTDLETEGVSKFVASFDELLGALDQKSGR